MGFVLDRAVILAGGEGKRLWPWTGPFLPKPLLPLGGNSRTLLGATLDRLAGLVDLPAVVLQAESRLGQRLIDLETRISREQLGTEPSARDTGPAVSLALARIAREKPDAIVGLFPADHRIQDPAAFHRAITLAARAARGGEVVLVGVPARAALTCYGYLHWQQQADGLYAVRRFIEKPDPAQAEELVRAGDHAWNAGMIVTRADRWLEQLAHHAPALDQGVKQFLDHNDYAAWERTPARSIDYLLLEKLAGLAAVELDAGWDDVGGWEAVGRIVAAGDAGDARLRELIGPGAAGSLGITIVGTVGPLLLAEPGPWLAADGPEGSLLIRRDRQDQIKQLLG